MKVLQPLPCTSFLWCVCPASKEEGGGSASRLIYEGWLRVFFLSSREKIDNVVKAETDRLVDEDTNINPWRSYYETETQGFGD